MKEVNKLLQNKMIQRIIMILIIAIIIYASYRFLGKIGADFKANRESKKHQKQLDELLKGNSFDEGGTVSQTTKTYKPAEYNLMADVLYTAMNGMGTDETSIYAVLSRLRTKADWYGLVAAFGEKKSNSVLGSFKGTLPRWLSDELGGDDKVKINNLLGKFNVQI